MDFTTFNALIDGAKGIAIFELTINQYSSPCSGAKSYGYNASPQGAGGIMGSNNPIITGIIISHNNKSKKDKRLHINVDSKYYLQPI